MTPLPLAATILWVSGPCMEQANHIMKRAVVWTTILVLAAFAYSAAMQFQRHPGFFLIINLSAAVGNTIVILAVSAVVPVIIWTVFRIFRRPKKFSFTTWTILAVAFVWFQLVDAGIP